MSDRGYMTLMGAEQVQAAAGQMQRAADDMRNAAGTFDEAVRQQRQFMEDWLFRFEAAVEKMPKGEGP